MLASTIIKSSNMGLCPVAINITPRIAIIIKVNKLGIFPLLTGTTRFSGRFNFKALRVSFGLIVHHI